MDASAEIRNRAAPLLRAFFFWRCGILELYHFFQRSRFIKVDVSRLQSILLPPPFSVACLASRRLLA